jgi:hypothetical protein
MSDNINNGLITKIWGRHGWEFLHAITFGYPINPTDDQKRDYKEYFKLCGHVFPCIYCRQSYQLFITQEGTELSDKVMESRHTLTLWLYNIHNAVNNKLGMDYGVTYEDLVNKYESCRAKCVNNKDISAPKGCNVPLDYKAESFKKANIKDCPIIPISYANIIMSYAICRKINIVKYMDIIKICFTPNISKTSELWIKRNKLCAEQINMMREKGIPSIETDGEFKDMPSIDETILLLMMSSNLSKTELEKSINHIRMHNKCVNNLFSLYIKN